MNEVSLADQQAAKPLNKSLTAHGPEACASPVKKTIANQPRAREKIRPGAAQYSSKVSLPVEPVPVILTIDAEVAPHTSDWKRDRGRFAIDRDIFGITDRGERGLRYQLEVIEQHGLKAVVFLEALSTSVVGTDLLKELVTLVQLRGHEVALHIHTEWLPYLPRPLVGDRRGRYMHDFSEDDQRRIMDQGLENLSRAGAERVVAFRAGNAGASLETLRAALRSGIRIDSSYFAPFLNRSCRLPSHPEISQAIPLEGVIEIPITWFRDGLGRIRPAQLCACSVGEFEHLLGRAWTDGWRIITLLLHSFELVRRYSPERPQTVVRLHERRLLRLCQLLAANAEKFVSKTFGELDTENILADPQPSCLRSPLGQTIWRYLEQATGRVW